MDKTKLFGIGQYIYLSMALILEFFKIELTPHIESYLINRTLRRYAHGENNSGNCGMYPRL